MSIVKDVAKTPGVAGAFVGTYGMQAYLIAFQGGGILAFCIASAVFVVITVFLCYWMGPLKPKPARVIGPLESSARRQIEAARLTGRFVGLAEAIAVRLGELEVGGFSAASDPEGYKEIQHRLALLEKVIETAKQERRDEKFANRNDVIQAELLGITVTESDIKTTTESDMDLTSPDPADWRVVPRVDPGAVFNASVDAEEKAAAQLKKQWDEKLKATRDALAKHEAKLDKYQAKLDKYNAKSDLAGFQKARPVHSGVKTIKNVQTQEQVDRRNERMNNHHSHDLTPYIRYHDNWPDCVEIDSFDY